MGEKVEIRSLFSEWHPTDRETARAYVLFLLRNMPGVRDSQKKDYIQKYKLCGATVDEILLWRRSVWKEGR